MAKRILKKKEIVWLGIAREELEELERNPKLGRNHIIRKLRAARARINITLHAFARD